MDNNIGVFSLGPVKTYKGHEGETCLQGTILKNGKKVADWSEDSHGGCHSYQFKNREDEKAFYEAANAHAIAVDYRAESKKKYGEMSGNHSLADLVISTIASAVDLERRQTAQLKRWCASKTVLKLANSAPDEYQTFKQLYSPAHEAAYMKRYPGCEIVNKRFI